MLATLCRHESHQLVASSLTFPKYQATYGSRIDFIYKDRSCNDESITQSREKEQLLEKYIFSENFKAKVADWMILRFKYLVK